MVDEPDLVALFYRADWTRLSLSAEVHELDDWVLGQELRKPARRAFSLVSTDLPPGDWTPYEHRARLRIAPGGRYVIGLLTAWDVPDPPGDGRVLRSRYRTRPGLPPPYPEVLWPSPLLNGFSLELAGRVQVAQYAGDAQVMRREFRKVAPLPADGSEPVFAVPPGVRVEHADGWLLDQVDLPAGARAAIRSAGSAAKAAYGFLSSLRRR
jgi:hypothetical protein